VVLPAGAKTFARQQRAEGPGEGKELRLKGRTVIVKNNGDKEKRGGIELRGAGRENRRKRFPGRKKKIKTLLSLVCRILRNAQDGGVERFCQESQN